MIDQLFNKKLINNYLARNNMRVEYFKDIQKLKDIIESIPKDDYPYQWDAAFNAEYLDTNDYFCLTLYQDNKLIGTYAARHMSIDSYMKEMNQFVQVELVIMQHLDLAFYN